MLPMVPNKGWSAAKEFQFNTFGYRSIVLSELRQFPFEDLSFLLRLERLNSLNIEASSRVLDVTVLEKLSNIQKLSLSFKKLRRPVDFSYLNELEEVWTVYAPQMESLFRLTNVRELTLLYWPGKDLQIFKEMKSLEKLSLIECTNVESLDGWEDLPSLNEVNLESSKKLSDVTIYSNLERPCKLFIDGKKLYRQADLTDAEAAVIIDKFGKERLDTFYFRK